MDPGGAGTVSFLRMTMRYLRPHVGRQIEISCYMLLGLAFTMAFPFVLRRLLDVAIPSGDFGEVMKLLVFITVVLVISMVADLRRSYVSATISASIVRQVRFEMFERLQVLSARWFSRNQQGDVMSRMFADVATMEAGVSQTIREGLFQILTIIASSIVALALEPLLGLIVLLSIPLVALTYRLMAKGARRRSMAVQEELGQVFGVAAENYGAQPVVKAFALEQHEGNRFAAASDRLVERQLRLQLFSGVFGLSVNAIVTTLRLVVLGLGAWMVINDSITIGTLVAFTSIVGQVVNPVGVLSGLGQQVQAASGALERIDEVLAAVPEVADEPKATGLKPLTQAIRFDNVSFAHTAGHMTLQDIECTIEAGTRVAFVGPTGAGKSSLLQLIPRFSDPDAGHVCFDGADIRHATLASLRGQIGMVFQDDLMFNTTVRENIALGKPGATEAEIQRAARAAEVHDAILAMPQGYDTTVGERGVRLSGGQRQRLAIARALIRDPRVLLLDEATSALDPRTERMIAETLDRVGHGRTTIAVTHRIASIASYDRIFVVVGGRIVEQGTHDELVARAGAYADLWMEQTGGRRAPTVASRIRDRLPPAHARDPVPLPHAATGPFALTPEAAWGGATGTGVRVAIIDSGIDGNHPDLAGCLDQSIEFVAEGEGSIAERAVTHVDSSGHGTACAGIVHTLAPAARITSVKVIGSAEVPKAQLLVRGLEWAIDQRFDVINIAIGTNRQEFALRLHELCDRAYFGASLVVTAANNSARDSFPSMFATVTSVACSPTRDPFEFDYNPDPPTEFLACGIDVDVPCPGGGHTRVTGNSFAAAHLAGIATLIKSRHPQMGPLQLKTALWATAANVRAAGHS